MPEDVPGEPVSETYMERSRAHTDRLCNQLRKNVFLVMLRNRSDDCCERGLVGEDMLLGNRRPELVEVDIFLWFRRIHLRFIFLNQSICNIRASSHVSFILR